MRRAHGLGCAHPPHPGRRRRPGSLRAPTTRSRRSDLDPRRRRAGRDTRQRRGHAPALDGRAVQVHAAQGSGAEDAGNGPTLRRVFPKLQRRRGGGRAFVGAGGGRRRRAEVAADHRHGVHRGESGGDVLSVEHGPRACQSIRSYICFNRSVPVVAPAERVYRRAGESPDENSANRRDPVPDPPHRRRRDVHESARGEPLDARAVDPRRFITPAGLTRIVAQDERDEGSRDSCRRGGQIEPERVEDAKPRTHQHPKVANLLRHLVREHGERLGPPRAGSAREERGAHRGAVGEVVHGVGDEVKVPDGFFPRDPFFFTRVVVLLASRDGSSSVTAASAAAVATARVAGVHGALHEVERDHSDHRGQADAVGPQLRREAAAVAAVAAVRRRGVGVGVRELVEERVAEERADRERRERSHQALGRRGPRGVLPVPGAPPLGCRRRRPRRAASFGGREQREQRDAHQGRARGHQRRADGHRVDLRAAEPDHVEGLVVRCRPGREGDDRREDRRRPSRTHAHVQPPILIP
mmetsp:Transcript_251/g.982  ORF Transcript_251/g.982 Transcript_251/m.982 type:complete len:525 (+) Transcript_251:662-2236(+)